MKGSIKAKSGIGALMLPTPFAWYAADDLMLSDNDPVTVWPDRGPNGLDATLVTVGVAEQTDISNTKTRFGWKTSNLKNGQEDFGACAPSSAPTVAWQ